jgi:hypothetical protein
MTGAAQKRDMGCPDLRHRVSVIGTADVCNCDTLVNKVMRANTNLHDDGILLRITSGDFEPNPKAAC